MKFLTGVSHMKLDQVICLGLEKTSNLTINVDIFYLGLIYPKTLLICVNLKLSKVTGYN